MPAVGRQVTTAGHLKSKRKKISMEGHSQQVGQDRDASCRSSGDHRRPFQKQACMEGHSQQLGKDRDASVCVCVCVCVCVSVVG
jgi:hypothetical protein